MTGWQKNLLSFYPRKLNITYFYYQMNYTDKYIIETYTGLMEGLSAFNKIELIDNLSKSLKEEEGLKDKKFYKSFGAFGSDKSAGEIIKEIKSSRKFRKKEISF